MRGDGKNGLYENIYFFDTIYRPQRTRTTFNKPYTGRFIKRKTRIISKSIYVFENIFHIVSSC